MKSFEEYIREKYGIVMPSGTISGAWFAENGIPMVVACTCCGMTMAAPNAMVDEEGHAYCWDCADYGD